MYHTEEIRILQPEMKSTIPAHREALNGPEASSAPHAECLLQVCDKICHGDIFNSPLAID
jgi:hypothetical protein